MKPKRAIKILPSAGVPDPGRALVAAPLIVEKLPLKKTKVNFRGNPKLLKFKRLKNSVAQ